MHRTRRPWRMWSAALALTTLAAAPVSGQPVPDPAAPPDPQPAPLPAPEPLPPPRPVAVPAYRAPQPNPSYGASGHDVRRPAVREQRNRHGLGVAGGMSSGSGFAYRRYFGDTMLQGAVWAMVLDRGDDATVWGGLTAAHYLFVWHDERRTSLLPETSALRLVGSASYLHLRDTQVNTLSVPKVAGCVPTLGNPNACEMTTESTVQVDRSHIISAGVGIGFEFGAIMRPGISLALDLQLTAIMDEVGLKQIWPLPSLAVMYSW